MAPELTMKNKTTQNAIFIEFNNNASPVKIAKMPVIIGFLVIL